LAAVTHSLFKSLRHTFQAFLLGLNWCTCCPFWQPISSLTILSAKQNLSSTCVEGEAHTEAVDGLMHEVRSCWKSSIPQSLELLTFRCHDIVLEQLSTTWQEDGNNELQRIVIKRGSAKCCLDQCTTPEKSWSSSGIWTVLCETKQESFSWTHSDLQRVHTVKNVKWRSGLQCLEFLGHCLCAHRFHWVKCSNTQSSLRWPIWKSGPDLSSLKCG